MKRLTHRRMNGIKEGYWSPNKKQELVERLGQYEDTGLTPGEIVKLKERDTVKAPERAEEQPYFRKHFHTMICPVCRRKIGETWKICAYCGQRLTESLLMDYIMRHTYSCPVKDDADIDFEKECVGFKEPGCRECIMRHLKELR